MRYNIPEKNIVKSRDKIILNIQGGKQPQTPRPQPQLQTSQEIYTNGIKISSMSDSGAKFHKPELIFDA